MTNPDLQRVLDKAVLGLFGPDSYASAFLTTIYCGLRFRWAPEIRTAQTNGISLWINPDWFQTLSVKMRVTLLAHELWHIAYMHGVRCGFRDPDIFNDAADHAINLMLIAHGYHFDILPNGEMLGLADPQYTGMSTEQIYELLIKKGGLPKLPFGRDFTIADGSDSPDQLTEEEKAEVIALVVKASVMSKMAGEDPGNLPGEVTSQMESLLRPKLKWTVLLDKWLSERSEEEFTWTRPNRRYQDVYLPSKAGDNRLGRLMYGIDCSCSLTDPQLLVINSELKGLKDTFNPVSMQIVSFDTQIQRIWELTDEDDLSSLEFIGRGGTSMFPLFELAKKEQPQALILFSDMECSYPPKPAGIDVLWICLDDEDWTPPYGIAIHIDSARDL